MPTRSGVSSVDCVEGVLPLGADLGCGAVVHRSRGVSSPIPE